MNYTRGHVSGRADHRDDILPHALLPEGVREILDHTAEGLVIARMYSAKRHASVYADGKLE